MLPTKLLERVRGRYFFAFDKTPFPAHTLQLSVEYVWYHKLLAILKREAFMAKLVRHLTSNEEIVSSNLAEGIFLPFFDCIVVPNFFLFS